MIVRQWVDEVVVFVGDAGRYAATTTASVFR